MTEEQTGPKIGLIDIETAPIEGYVWGLFDQNVGLNQIKTEWTLLSFCFKPLYGGKNTIVYKDNSKAANPRDDLQLLKDLWVILDTYDFLIAQNGKRFDMRKIRARMIMENFPVPSPCKVIDTMLMARQVAAFTSNKLEWLADKLSPEKKSRHKKFPGFELWSECLKGNPAAWKEMRAYNIPDVTSMEHVYLRLRPWVEGHPNVAVYTDSTELACNRCGSTDMVKRGYAYTQVGQYHRYRCGGCGGWSKSRYTLNSTDKRKALVLG